MLVLLNLSRARHVRKLLVKSTVGLTKSLFTIVILI